MHNKRQKELAEKIQTFGKKKISPHRRAWDEAQALPPLLFKKLGQLGLLGILVPKQYGGADLSYHEYVTAVVELAKLDPAVALSVAAHNSLCIGHILAFGNVQQKKKWLPKLTNGTWLGAWALTEPDAGSDAGNMQTMAQLTGDYWVINGKKHFITHGKSSHIVVVMAKTENTGNTKGMTAFAIEKSTPGIIVSNKDDKMGICIN